MKKIIVITAFFIAGCMSSEEISGLLALKRVSVSQAQQSKAIDAQEARFQKVLRYVRENKLSQGRSMDWVLSAFGEPSLTEVSDKDLAQVKYLMYRHPDKYFGSERVYLYFDKDAKLTDWKYEEGY